MTGQEIKELSESILDNNVDWSNDFYYQLLDVAKTKLEESRLWQYLKKSAILSSSALPADFAQDYKVLIGTNECFPVPFEDQYNYHGNNYYIDLANSTINFLGTTSGTRYLFYKRFTPVITPATSPVFPDRFQPLLAFMVSGYFQMGVDSDDIFARMSPENKAAARELQQAMVSWDTALAMRAQNDRVGVSGSQTEVPLSQM
jgi:hypothetical protein